MLYRCPNDGCAVDLIFLGPHAKGNCPECSWSLAAVYDEPEGVS